MRRAGRTVAMKWMMVVVVMVAGMGAGRTTRPTTGPALIDVKPLSARLDAAEEAMTKAKAEARHRWESSAEYLRLKKDLDDRRAARDKAKAGSDLQARLDTAKAYNDARRAFETADAKGGDGDQQVAEASRLRDSAARELADAARENSKLQDEADAKDPIKRAMKEGRLVPGMNMAQVRSFMQVPGEVMGEEDGTTLYRFHRPDATGLTDYWVWFVDGSVHHYVKGARTAEVRH